MIETVIDEDDIMRRALAAYFRRLPGADWPGNDSAVEEHEGRHYAILRNVNGILAVYRIKTDGFLKGLRRWPKAIEEQ